MEEIKIVEKTAQELQDYQISPEENYKRLKECRDFEISHLWQRSIFLATFLLAIITSYGTFSYNSFIKNPTLEVEINQDNTKMIYTLPYELIDNLEYKDVIIKTQVKNNIVATSLCWLGIIFSLLWIMMGKGSKYWFEKYEAAINSYVWGDAGILLREGKWAFHGNLPDLDEISNNPLNTVAFRFSVSKINIAIGIISLIIFSVLSLIHLFIVLSYFMKDLFINQIIGFTGLFFLILFILIYLILYALCASKNK